MLGFVLNPQWLAALNVNNGANQPVWTYLVAFAYYFCNYFVIVFFNAALISCALLQFHGETPTLGDGLRAAWSRLPQILAWALVSATVGMLLKAVENVHEKAGQITLGGRRIEQHATPLGIELLGEPVDRLNRHRTA